MIEAGLIQILLSAADVTAIAGDRVKPAGSQCARPNVIYQRLSTGRTMTNDGPADRSRARVQFNCYADDYGTAKRLADAVRRSVNGARGTFTDAGGTPRTIDRARVVDELDIAPTAQPGFAETAYGVAIPVIVLFQEAAN